MRKQIYLNLFGNGKEEFELVNRMIICADIRLVGSPKQKCNILMRYEVRKNGQTYKFNQESTFICSFASLRRLIKFFEVRQPNIDAQS